MPTDHGPSTRLLFVGEFTDLDAYNAQARGYLSHVLVQVGGGRLYPVVFYDPVRLGQDLEELAARGRPFLAEPGMIVVHEVTPEAMRTAAQGLAAEGFFDRMTPVTPDELATSDPHAWPPRRGVKDQAPLPIHPIPIPDLTAGSTHTPAGPRR